MPQDKTPLGFLSGIIISLLEYLLNYFLHTVKESSLSGGIKSWGRFDPRVFLSIFEQSLLGHSTYFVTRQDELPRRNVS